MYYLYLIFKINTITDKINVIVLAITIGKDLIKIPYTSHRKTPIVKVIAHIKETSLVDFVFQALTTWGIRAIVVNVPAKNPIMSMYAI